MEALADIWKSFEGETVAGIISLPLNLRQSIYSILLLSCISTELFYSARNVSSLTGVLQASLLYFKWK